MLRKALKVPKVPRNVNPAWAITCLAAGVPIFVEHHPANSGGLQQLKLKYNFSYFLFRFWGCSCKDIQQIQKDIPRQKLLETLSFVLPAKTIVL